MKAHYESAGAWPDDGVDVEDAIFTEFALTVPPGKTRVVGRNGLPAWEDIPPPTQEEIISAVTQEKQRRVEDANQFINSKQWPGKAAIGRLKEIELSQYNKWLDYLDALEAVDISTAPRTEWPEEPS